ncbi:unnamed protein product, partial [marine sediment metagenome]
LPAVRYDGNANEHEAACSGDFYLNQSTLSPATNYCWAAACGDTSGAYWATHARRLGYDSCAYQDTGSPSGTHDDRSFRVVVSPEWQGDPDVLTEDNCNALAGWTWLNGACWSNAIADSVSWNKGVWNDTSTTGSYTPNSSGTLKSRMEAVVAGRWSEICTDINGVTITTAMDGATGKPNISAMAITDCIDGSRDIGPTISGADWETRSDTLKAWATAAGHSALPAVDHDGANNEYEAACSGDFYLNQSTLSPATNWCWAARLRHHQRRWLGHLRA